VGAKKHQRQPATALSLSNECLSTQSLSFSFALSDSHKQVRALVERGVATRQRSLFVIVGDKARDQVREIFL
jgi:hypothetical protein